MCSTLLPDGGLHDSTWLSSYYIGKLSWNMWCFLYIIFQNTDCTRVLPQITGWFCSRIIFVWVSWFWWPTFPPPTLACSASSAPGECSGPPPLTIIMSPSSISSLSFFQDTIYYKWASVKMTLKFHFLWSTLFWLEESVSAVYSDWLRGKSEANSCSWSAAEVWRQH